MTTPERAVAASAASTETIRKPTKRERFLERIGTRARVYDRADCVPGSAFMTTDNEKYVVSKGGAFVRPGKDRRSVKERKRSRRELREQAA